MAHNVKAEEISKCTRKSVNALRNARRSFRSKAHVKTEFRDTGIRKKKKICKDYAMNCRAVPIA